MRQNNKEFIMHTFRTLSFSLAALLLTTCGDSGPTNQSAALFEASIALAADAISVTGNDIGGSVTSSNGPEAGVWVIAETRDLETLYSKTVVTDDQGRYLIPDLPEANFELWVRGYGLVDSSRSNANPGQTLDLIAQIAPNAAAAAEYPPAHASTRRICQCTCWHVQRRTARPPICRCELHLQHQISCRVFGMGGAIEQAVENGVRDSYGRSAELLDAYLRRGGGDSREDAVLVDATPDTAGSPNPNPQLYP